MDQKALDGRVSHRGFPNLRRLEVVESLAAVGAKKDPEGAKAVFDRCVMIAARYGRAQKDDDVLHVLLDAPVHVPPEHTHAWNTPGLAAAVDETGVTASARPIRSREEQRANVWYASPKVLHSSA